MVKRYYQTRTTEIESPVLLSSYSLALPEHIPPDRITEVTLEGVVTPLGENLPAFGMLSGEAPLPPWHCLLTLRKEPDAYHIATTVTPEPLPRDHRWATFPADDAAYANIARIRYVAFRRYLCDLGSAIGVDLLLQSAGNHRLRDPTWTIAPSTNLFDPSNTASLHLRNAKTRHLSLGGLAECLVDGVSALHYAPFDVTVQYDTHPRTSRRA
jgi:hypothetical protein